MKVPMPILQVSSVCKTYVHSGNVTHALRDIALTVEAKEIYGIIGLSGAGKSTLIRCLAGLIEPSSGDILFLNQKITGFQGQKLRAFRQKIGMIFQHFNLLSSRTVAENIAYPLEIAGVSKVTQDKRVDELLEFVGLRAKKHSYPALLSGGEKQRVAIARALANDPDILFCDEATSALDPRTTKTVLDLLKTINQKLGLTIVLITHDMDVIKRICNRVAVMEGGTIVEEGFVSDVFSSPKHPTTKNFIQGSSHEIPPDFFHPLSPNRKLLRLRFKGATASEPLISHLVKKYQVEANILLGWLDRLQTTTVGTLIIELTGNPEAIEGSLAYLTEKNVHYEVLTNHG